VLDLNTYLIRNKVSTFFFPGDWRLHDRCQYP
jgi:hypothetical protein